MVPQGGFKKGAGTACPRTLLDREGLSGDKLSPPLQL